MWSWNTEKCRYQPIWPLSSIFLCFKQGCGVGGKISDTNSDLSKISDFDTYSDFSTKRECTLAVNNFVAANNQRKSLYTATILFQ